CHSPAGDLEGIGAKVTNQERLEALWLAGGAVQAADREPPAAHLTLRPQYTDKNLRDLTAYLASLK
ncbi:MAG: hypothetical protein ABI818_17205, partial [Acidobacteriota bacterium]